MGQITLKAAAAVAAVSTAQTISAGWINSDGTTFKSKNMTSSVREGVGQYQIDCTAAAFVNTPIAVATGVNSNIGCKVNTKADPGLNSTHFRVFTFLLATGAATDAEFCFHAVDSG